LTIQLNRPVRFAARRVCRRIAQIQPAKPFEDASGPGVRMLNFCILEIHPGGPPSQAGRQPNDDRHRPPRRSPARKKPLAGESRSYSPR
jgi:hypothetical protein